MPDDHQPQHHYTAHDTGRRPLHILVVNLPQHGHVNPTLGVVRELTERGHRVSYVTTDTFAPQVTAAGAAPVLLRSAHCRADDAPESLADGAMLALQDARLALAGLTAAFDSEPPDAVLHDLQAFAGPVLARRWEKPAVQLNPSHALYQGWQEELHGTSDLTRHALFPAFEAFAAEHAPGVPALDFLLRAAHSVVFLPRSFQRRSETVGDEHAFVGPVIDERPHQGDWRPRDGSSPVLLVSLGSLYTNRPAFFAECMEAFADGAWQVVMAVGAGLDLDALPAIPPNIEVHRSVPQLRILEHAQAFITHAGMGSTMEAIVYGVPMVAIPQMAEQRVNADQIERLGLGRHLAQDRVSGPALRQAVENVAGNPAIAANLAAMRQEIGQCGGARAAADLIETACGYTILPMALPPAIA
ncbi:macrolide family glycosyltransferase [Planobispora rosea]|uniref:macrolide family glycosyltransferase n=1 Tax=Planobispora rosea TaxID=35762 RepID=UPI00083B1CF4|nr:macrolide family glycosyltransferase [Planobispora rosea]